MNHTERWEAEHARAREERRAGLWPAPRGFRVPLAITAPAPTPKKGPPMRTVVTFDTETTGVDRHARLVEIAAIRWQDGKEIERFATLVNPGIPMPEAATKVNGITDEMLKDAPRAPEALGLFLAFIGSADIAAHNADFDMRIIESELSRAQMMRPENRVVCTLRIARQYLARLGNHKLATVAHHFGLMDGPQEHRALGDALLVGGVYWRLREIAREARA